MLDPDIQLFLMITAECSLSAAGRRLGLSTPMMSKRLARLEARLGVALFRRTTRRLELTTSGERYHTDMVALAAAADDARARLSGGSREPYGPLRIAAPTSFARLHIVPSLPMFLDRHPRVELDLQLSDHLVDLLSERIDLAVRITGEVGAGFRGEKVASNRRMLCAAPAYLERHGMPTSPADLAHHHLLAAERQLPWRLASPGRVHLVQGTSRVKTNSSEAIRELTLAGAGVSLRSLWDVGEDLSAGRLIPVLPGIEGSAEIGVHMVRPKAALVSPAVVAFEAHLRQILSPPPWDR